MPLSVTTNGRSIRIDGSRGSIEGRFTYAGERLELFFEAAEEAYAWMGTGGHFGKIVIRL